MPDAPTIISASADPVICPDQPETDEASIVSPLASSTDAMLASKAKPVSSEPSLRRTRDLISAPLLRTNVPSGG